MNRRVVRCRTGHRRELPRAVYRHFDAAGIDLKELAQSARYRLLVVEEAGVEVTSVIHGDLVIAPLLAEVDPVL